jgi:hypothetical protein
MELITCNDYEVKEQGSFTYLVSKIVTNKSVKNQLTKK